MLNKGIEKVVFALIDDRMASAFGFPKSSPQVTEIVEGALRARSAFVRRLPKRRVSLSAGNATNRTYPGYPLGYRPNDLGVEH